MYRNLKINGGNKKMSVDEKKLFEKLDDAIKKEKQGKDSVKNQVLDPDEVIAPSTDLKKEIQELSEKQDKLVKTVNKLVLGFAEMKLLLNKSNDSNVLQGAQKELIKLNSAVKDIEAKIKKAKKTEKSVLQKEKKSILKQIDALKEKIKKSSN